MREELEKKLYEKYPDIFCQKDLPMNETCMCWGICCGDGWYDIIDTLCANIENYIKNTVSFNQYLKQTGKPEKPVPKIEAVQVKEKYGGLRFYVNIPDEHVDGLICMAESMSYHICEYCGNKGKPNSSGWITTLCDSCRTKKDEKYKNAKSEETC